MRKLAIALMLATMATTAQAVDHPKWWTLPGLPAILKEVGANARGGDGGTTTIRAGLDYMVIVPGQQGRADGTPGKGADPNDLSHAIILENNKSGYVIIRYPGYVAQVAKDDLATLIDGKRKRFNWEKE